MHDNKTIPELTKDVAGHLGDMFRNELKLARVEATEGVKSLGVGVGQILAGAIVGSSALTVALLAMSFGLSAIMPMWGACLAVAAVSGLIAVSMVKGGLKAMASRDLTLPKTREQVARDVEAVAEQVH